AVLLEDGSTISLPASLKQVWRGCGGSASAAALKLTVRLDLLRGSLSGPYVQEGRRHETQSPLREQHMPAGSLWIGDLGYFALTWLTQLVKQGVFFLMGYKEPVVMWNAQGEQVEVLDLLPSDGSEMVDIPVTLGARKQLQARLIAKQMSEAVVKRRREQLKAQAHKQCKPINPRQWELVQWAIVLTMCPPVCSPHPRPWPCCGHVGKWNCCGSYGKTRASSMSGRRRTHSASCVSCMPNCWACWCNIGCSCSVVGTTPTAHW